MPKRRRSRTRRSTRRGGRLVLAVVAILLAAGFAFVLRDEGRAGELRQVAGAAWEQIRDGLPGAADGVTGAGDRATDADGGAAGLGGLRPPLAPDTARAALAALPETDAAPAGLPDYARDDYGERWADVDGNGCNQRDDVLLRDARPGSVRTAPQRTCAADVVAGTWLDPYTGASLTFDDLKNEVQAQAISIDHVVPLAEAHRSGAAGWQPQQKTEFANDLDNLLAVDGPTNASKGDADPSRWLPPDASSWCAYAVVWVSVKTEWALAVDAEERAALEQVLAGC